MHQQPQEETALEMRIAFDLAQERGAEPTQEQRDELNAYFDRIEKENAIAIARYASFILAGGLQ